MSDNDSFRVRDCPNCNNKVLPHKWKGWWYIECIKCHRSASNPDFKNAVKLWNSDSGTCKICGSIIPGEPLNDICSAHCMSRAQHKENT